MDTNLEEIANKIGIYNLSDILKQRYISRHKKGQEVIDKILDGIDETNDGIRLIIKAEQAFSVRNYELAEKLYNEIIKKYRIWLGFASYKLGLIYLEKEKTIENTLYAKSYFEIALKEKEYEAAYYLCTIYLYLNDEGIENHTTEECKCLLKIVINNSKKRDYVELANILLSNIEAEENKLELQ